MRALLVAATLVGGVLVAGCSASEIGDGNFELKAGRIGWNTTETASFTLTLRASAGVPAPEFTIDPDFAIETVEFDTGAFGGDYETENPAKDLSLQLLVNGTSTREARMSLANPTVEIRVVLPDALKDDAYRMRLQLFRAGTVESDDFRVNRP